ncbi:MAG: single-stranded DNA-binding protein [Acidaminococcaceae bacterium]|nr:single-stranded DNA-binding protein [Acidaminococcaceae bacterium]
MNQLIIIGNLTRDPESRSTQSGKQVCTFSVAVTRRNDRDKSDFFRVNAWGELGNNCARYLSKGKKVCVIGQVSVSTYTTQNGETRANMDVFAEKVEFLSPAGNAQQNAPQAPKTDAQSGFVQVDDEIPF